MSMSVIETSNVVVVNKNSRLTTLYWSIKYISLPSHSSLSSLLNSITMLLFQVKSRFVVRMETVRWHSLVATNWPDINENIQEISRSNVKNVSEHSPVQTIWPCTTSDTSLSHLPAGVERCHELETNYDTCSRVLKGSHLSNVICDMFSVILVRTCSLQRERIVSTDGFVPNWTSILLMSIDPSPVASTWMSRSVSTASFVW
jgi:hypothetical protein